MKPEKLLYPFANVLGLFFPVGKLENGGTCEFATLECLKKCCAFKGGEKIDFDLKQKCFDYFRINTKEIILEKIIQELKEKGETILTWFASGDCPKFLTSKFAWIVHRLDNEGIIQVGFTRNDYLYDYTSLDIKNGKVLLTMENYQGIKTSGLYSIPDYKTGAINIIKVIGEEKFLHDGCRGSSEFKIKNKEKVKSHLKLDCRYCYENKTGCFTEIPIMKKACSPDYFINNQNKP